jgi:SAM-dependent methyltransferase
MRRATELSELMDDPLVPRAELETSLRFIRRVNRYLGGTRAVLGHVERFSRQWARGEPITLLDVATGSADIPEALLAWASRHRHRLHVIALDLHETTLAVAREWVPPRPALTYIRGDALALPLADASVDYATCSMFLHHLTEEQALAAVREMLRVARRGVVVNDLLRGVLAYAGVTALTLAAPPIDRHDARVSVRKGWAPAEVRRWPGVLNAPFLRFRHHLFSRFTLAGER